MFAIAANPRRGRPETGKIRCRPGSIARRLWQNPRWLFTFVPKGKAFMTEEQNNEERPCLHCMMVDLIDDYFAEYAATAGGSDTVDTGEADEVIVAIAKTVAEFTSRQDGTVRQQLIEELMREIMHYDAEFRLENEAGATGSAARH